ncbi:MAG: universal stress protein [Povalibacter sp.]
MQAQQAAQWNAPPLLSNESQAAQSRAGLRRILCVSDLQAPSDLALGRATALGRRFNAQVHVLYVDTLRRSQPVLHVIRDHHGLGPGTRMEMFRERPTAGSIEVRAVTAPLYEALAHIDEQFNIDMVVVPDGGTNRHSWLNVERIIRSVSSPVLVVRREAAMPYERITVATDLSERSLKLSRAMATYGWLDAPSIAFVHAFGLPYRGLRKIPQAIPKHLELYRTRWQRLVLQQMRADLEITGLDTTRVSLHADLATPIDLIERHVGNSGADLLVAGATRFMQLKAPLGKSVTRDLLNRIDCDILVVT